MGIQYAEWLIPNRLIYAYAEEGPVTLDEYQIHNSRLVAYLTAGTPLVHVILDSHPKHKAPVPNIRQIAVILSFLRHKSLGWSLVISPKQDPLNFGSAVLSQLFKVRYRRMADVAEAIAFLREVDETVHWGDIDTSIVRSDLGN